MQKDVEVSEITDIKDIDSAELAKNENAKFSFGGATLYGINAVIGSGIFLCPNHLPRFRSCFSCCNGFRCGFGFDVGRLLRRSCGLLQ